MNPYFSLSDKVFDVTERYPELIELLAANGFENLRNDMMRKTIGKTISVETAVRSKHFDPAAFERQMVETIAQQKPALSSGLGEARQNEPSGELKLSGVLPCPIRVQLLEKLDGWLSRQKTKVNYELQAASMGLDWLREQFLSGEADAFGLSDVYLSAGFSLFFDQKLADRYMRQGVFADLTGMQRLNRCFDNDAIDLKDPRRQYSIIGVVPAIFMVNTELLGDRPFPESWADLMRPEFGNTIALPMQDLDLFNAVLLGIYSRYGEEGVSKLGRGLRTSMHPAQMIKSAGRKQDDAPVITVMPYFFSWMAKEGGPMRAVWPKDGAIVSPIFLLTKASSREKSQPLVDFLSSKEMGEVLSANGKFPSTHPEVDNGLSAEQTFLWPGWDYIHSHDIGALLAKTAHIFFDAAGGVG